MLALHQMSVTDELVKWSVLLVVAVVVGTLLATRMAAADSKPGLLPPELDRLAKPMPDSTRPFFPEVGPPLRTIEPNQVLWRIIELHRMGQVEEAIAQWERAGEMCGSEVWRHVAVAAAYPQAGDLEQAEAQLDAALEMEPQNAPAPAVMFIASPAVAPNTRDMYELMAMQEFAKAIELAAAIDLEAPLAPDAWAAEDVQYLPLVTPSIGDPLLAIGADRYPARAHNVLGQMLTERGLFEEAKEHLDTAAAEQMNGPKAYRDLSADVEAEGRYDDMRVLLKAFRNGDVNLISAIKMFINGWKAADGK